MKKATASLAIVLLLLCLLCATAMAARNDHLTALLEICRAPHNGSLCYAAVTWTPAGVDASCPHKTGDACYLYSGRCANGHDQGTYHLSQPVHACNFDQQNTDAKYLAAEADCVTAAQYYYSCTCGEKGTQTFSSGAPDSSNHKGDYSWADGCPTGASTTDEECPQHAQVCNACHQHTGVTADHQYKPAGFKNAASCSEQGYYKYQCEACKHVKTTYFSKSYILTYVPAQDATCTQRGWNGYYTCSNKCCEGKYFDAQHNQLAATDVFTGPLEHDYTGAEWATVTGDPAHVDEHVMYCTRSNCDDHEGSARYEKCAGTVWNYGVDEIDYDYHYLDCAKCSQCLDAQPHDWGKGLVTRMPDCWNEGIVKYHCPTCGLDKYETLPALGHWFETVELKSTCTGAGYTARKCVRCGLIVDKDKVDPAGHKMGEWETVKAPTCTEAGEEIQKCTVCGVLLDTREVEATGHNWGEWAVVTPATAETEGLEKRVCRNDESHVETRPIEKLQPTVKPTDEPTQEPTDEPAQEPTQEPTQEPADDSDRKDDGKTDIPKTGDSRKLGALYLLMTMAAAGLCALAATRRED